MAVITFLVTFSPVLAILPNAPHFEIHCKQVLDETELDVLNFLFPMAAQKWPFLLLASMHFYKLNSEKAFLSHYEIKYFNWSAYLI